MLNDLFLEKTLRKNGNSIVFLFFSQNQTKHNSIDILKTVLRLLKILQNKRAYGCTFRNYIYKNTLKFRANNQFDIDNIIINSKLVIYQITIPFIRMSRNLSANREQLLISGQSSFKKVIPEMNNSMKRIIVEENSQYLYTPMQYLISKLLTNKKTVQDDLINILKDITKIRTKKQPLTKMELNEQLNLKKKQLELIKRQLSQSCKEQTQVYNVIKKRIHTHNNIPKKHQKHLKKQENIKNKNSVNSEKQVNSEINNHNQFDQQFSQTLQAQSIFNRTKSYDIEAPQTPIKRVSLQQNCKIQEEKISQRSISSLISSNEEIQIQKYKMNRLKQLKLNKQIVYYLLGKSIKAQNYLKKKDKKQKERLQQEKLKQLRERQRLNQQKAIEANRKQSKQVQQNQIQQEKPITNENKEPQKNQNSMPLEPSWLDNIIPENYQVPSVFRFQNYEQQIEQNNMFQLQNLEMINPIQRDMHIPFSLNALESQDWGERNNHNSLMRQAQDLMPHIFRDNSRNNIFLKMYYKDWKERFNIQKETEKNKIQKIQPQTQDPYKVEDILNEKQYIQQLNLSHQKSLKRHRGQIQQQNLSQIEKSFHYEDQLQLQCQLYRKMYDIAQQIQQNNFQGVNHFIRQHSHQINKMNSSNLQFWVIICQAVNKIKSKVMNQQMQAIELIREKIKRMDNKIQEWQKTELQKITGMLLMSQESIHIQKYLQSTLKCFIYTYQRIYRLPDTKTFLKNLFIGGLILKTPTCQTHYMQNSLICPICCPLLQNIFEDIPILTRNQSSLICRINGSIMDQENYPIMLPSKQIYSIKGLESRKKQNKNEAGKKIYEYYCPVTQTWYNTEQARKVFVA